MTMKDLWKLPTTWKWIELGEISEVVSKGTTPTTVGDTFRDIGIPFLRAEDITGGAINPNTVTFRIDKKTHTSVLSRSRLQPGDLLITIAGTLGRVGYVPDNVPQLNCNQAVAFARLRSTLIDVQFACFACQYEGVINSLIDQKKVGTIGNLNLQQLQEFRIPLPSLLEQKRIATILEKADRLRRLRRYALKLSGTYLQSVFLGMFSKNADSHWPNESIELLSQEKKGAIRTGPFGSQLLHSEFVKEGIAVLGIDNAVQNRFEWGVRRFITEEKYQELKRYKVFPGDVIITIMGTPGRCAVIPENIPLAINTKHLCCITLDQSRCLPTYLKFCFLTHPSVLRQLNVSEHGAVMPGLNMEIIKELIVPCPPLALQQKFTEIVQKFEHLFAQQREAERQAEHLFQTLLHKAFQGELSLDEDEMLMPDVERVHQRMPAVADVIEPIDTDAFQMALPME